MKKKTLIVVCLFVSSIGYIQTQTLNDSIQNIEIKKSTDSIKRISNSISILEKYYNSFNDSISKLAKNYNTFSEILSSANVKIQKLTDKEVFSNQYLLEQRTNKIINSTEFVRDADACISIIDLLDLLSLYLKTITKLNSPVNSDLGLSLSTAIGGIIKRNIIDKAEKKGSINGVSSSKFLDFIKNILASPVIRTITSGIPIVSSINSVIDLVNGTAIKGDKISIQEVEALKDSLNVYIQYYDGLAKCQLQFDQNLSNLGLRKSVLISILNQYTIERINTLTENSITEEDKVKIELNKNKIEFKDLILKKYSKDTITNKIQSIINTYHLNSNPLNFIILMNKQLIFPDYALYQARFIRDEIEALRKEYIAMYQSNQISIDSVLNKSKSIGFPGKIDEKITELNSALNAVITSINANLNIKQLNVTLNKLFNY